MPAHSCTQRRSADCAWPAGQGRCDLQRELPGWSQPAYKLLTFTLRDRGSRKWRTPRPPTTGSVTDATHLSSLDAFEALPPELAVTLGKPGEAVAASPTEHIVSVLRGLLPEGAMVAVCWRDWALGSGAALSPGGSTELRSRAEHALSESDLETDSPHWLVHAWDNADGNARMAVAAALCEPLADAERKSWLAT